MKALWFTVAMAVVAGAASASAGEMVYRATVVNVIEVGKVVVRYSRPGEMGMEGVTMITMLAENTAPKPGCDPAVNTAQGTIMVVRSALKEASFVLEQVVPDEKGRPAKAVVRLRDGGSLGDLMMAKGLYCPASQ